jgi:hypothetical protein
MQTEVRLVTEIFEWLQLAPVDDIISGASGPILGKKRVARQEVNQLELL